MYFFYGNYYNFETNTVKIQLYDLKKLVYPIKTET